MTMRKQRKRSPLLAPLAVGLRGLHAAAGRGLAMVRGLAPAERDTLVATLHAYLGLPAEYIREADLRITPERFQKELLRGERRTGGRLEGRSTDSAHDAAGGNRRDDPSRWKSKMNFSEITLLQGAWRFASRLIVSGN